MSQQYRRSHSLHYADRELLPAFLLLWLLCAANVVNAILHPPFAGRPVLCLVMLFILPFLLRRTLASLFRPRRAD